MARHSEYLLNDWTNTIPKQTYYLSMVMKNIVNAFSFIFISWSLITLQYCSGFCHTLTWISHGFTCIPHPDPPSHLPLHPIPLGLPSAPGPRETVNSKVIPQHYKEFYYLEFLLKAWHHTVVIIEIKLTYIFYSLSLMFIEMTLDSTEYPECLVHLIFSS